MLQLVWFGRDLRVDNHEALFRAARCCRYTSSDLGYGNSPTCRADNGRSGAGRCSRFAISWATSASR
jgi:deoxyribodipyrimidine photolyase